MPVDAFTTQPHYLDHLAPIFIGLREQAGHFYVAGGVADSGASNGIPRRRLGYPGDGGPVLVAGYMDEQPLVRSIIYLEHGAGQTYGGDSFGATHPAYAGTPGHDRVVLFLSPNERTAQRWRDRYPRARAVAIGSPKLDRLHLKAAAAPWKPPEDRAPVVAITFHHDGGATPEGRSALDHYSGRLAAVVAELGASGVTVLGHGHPRIWRTLRPLWKAIGVEPVHDLSEVFSRADVLVGDNTSAVVEFASLGRPIVWANAPWYRREVEHGGRFWSWTKGQIMVDGPEELPGAILVALGDEPEHRAAREEMVADAYMACDGKATERAVAAIMELPGTGPYQSTRGRDLYA